MQLSLPSLPIDSQAGRGARSSALTVGSTSPSPAAGPFADVLAQSGATLADPRLAEEAGAATSFTLPSQLTGPERNAGSDSAGGGELYPVELATQAVAIGVSVDSAETAAVPSESEDKTDEDSARDEGALAAAALALSPAIHMPASTPPPEQGTQRQPAASVLTAGAPAPSRSQEAGSKAGAATALAPCAAQVPPPASAANAPRSLGRGESAPSAGPDVSKSPVETAHQPAPGSHGVAAPQQRSNASDRGAWTAAGVSTPSTSNGPGVTATDVRSTASVAPLEPALVSGAAQPGASHLAGVLAAALSSRSAPNSEADVSAGSMRSVVITDARMPMFAPGEATLGSSDAALSVPQGEAGPSAEAASTRVDQRGPLMSVRSTSSAAGEVHARVAGTAAEAAAQPPRESVIAAGTALGASSVASETGVTAKQAPGTAPSAATISERRGDTENIAVRSTARADKMRSARSTDIKSSLAADAKEYATSKGPFGIPGAKSQASMPQSLVTDRATVLEPSLAQAGAALGEEFWGNTSAEAGAVPTAHRAVAAVLNATETLASRDQRSVFVKFDMDGSDLGVRVELRGGEVHTTFRTDSPELRAALATEWQTTAQTQDRSIRLASPVFEGSSGSGASLADHGSNRERHAETRPHSPQFGFGPAAKESVAGVKNPSPELRLPASNARHLHTLA